MKYNKLIPELSVKDINASKKFYLDLGFNIMYEREEDKFVFLELEENQIMIEELNGHWDVGEMEYPFGRGINISMTVSNIEDIYNRAISCGYKIFLDMEVHEYRVDDEIIYEHEFLIQDMDGYLLRFND